MERSCPRYQDIMPWDQDGDTYLINEDMDKLYNSILSNSITGLPEGHAFLLRHDKRKGLHADSCSHNHPIVFFDKVTGIYIDLMLLKRRGNGKTVAHCCGYIQQKSSYEPLQDCNLAGIPFKCPSKPLHFIGPPGRDYQWETIKLDGTLANCPFYEHLNLIHYTKNNLTEMRSMYWPYWPTEGEIA